jgi:hypothetical protein
MGFGQMVNWHFIKNMIHEIRLNGEWIFPQEYNECPGFINSLLDEVSKGQCFEMGLALLELLHEPDRCVNSATSRLVRAFASDPKTYSRLAEFARRSRLGELRQLMAGMVEYVVDSSLTIRVLPREAVSNPRTGQGDAKFKDFRKWYSAEYGRRLEMERSLSTATLTLGDFEITCDLDTAALLTEFVGPTRLDEAAQRARIDLNVAEAIAAELEAVGVIAIRRGLVEVVAPEYGSILLEPRRSDVKFQLTSPDEVDRAIVEFLKKTGGAHEMYVIESVTIRSPGFVRERLELLRRRGIICGPEERLRVS